MVPSYHIIFRGCSKKSSKFHENYDIHCMKAGTSSMKNHVFDKEQFGIEGKVSVVASFDNETFCVLKIHSQEYIILRGNGSGMFSNLLDTPSVLKYSAYSIPVLQF